MNHATDESQVAFHCVCIELQDRNACREYLESKRVPRSMCMHCSFAAPWWRCWRPGWPHGQGQRAARILCAFGVAQCLGKGMLGAREDGLEPLA